MVAQVHHTHFTPLSHNRCSMARFTKNEEKRMQVHKTLLALAATLVMTMACGGSAGLAGSGQAAAMMVARLRL